MPDATARHFGGPLLYKSRNQNSPFDNLPIDIVNQIGPDGLSGIQYYFNHFHQWEGPVAEGSAGGWTLSGTTGAATIVLSDVRNGEITLTADATGSANPTLALGSATVGMNFRYVVGKQLWLGARLKLGTVATTEVFLGLGTADTSPTVTGTLPADGIFFHKASTATRLSFQARKDGTGTDRANVTGVLTNATYTDVEFYVDPNGNIHAYQAGVELPAAIIRAGTANIPSGAADTLQLLIGILGASMTMGLDWLYVAQEI